MLETSMKKNDKKAHWLIWIFSIVVFFLITVSEMTKLDVELPFDPHLFADANAFVNSAVAILLLIALWFVKSGNYKAHKNTILIAMALSIFFLVFYVSHHIFSGRTLFGDANHDGDVSDMEISSLGFKLGLYKSILYSHILLAGVVMPFVLYTAYRALIGEFSIHKKLARWVFPIWLYVAVTGVIVYLMISPYYT